MVSSKLINGVYIKNGVYLTTGGLYQSTLSNQSLINIKKVIKNTGKRFVSISTKIRNTCCFTTKEELEEVCKVDKKVVQGKANDLSNYLLDSENIPTIKSLPLVCPLGLYIIENYPPLQRKKENCIIAMKLGDKETKNGIVPIFSAITIYNDSLYFHDKNGEFVGTVEELLIYVKKIKNKIILNSIHSTEECFQKIEDTFLNENFSFKRIGVEQKDINVFKYNSDDVFFSKKALSNANKIKYYNFHEKEEKLKKILIISAIAGVCLSGLGWASFSYYEKVQEEEARAEAARIEAMKPKVEPTVNFNTIDYFNKFCFKDIDKFNKANPSWALQGITCNVKGVSYKIISNTDLGNYLTNQEDFYKSYDIESKTQSKYKFDSSGKAVTYSPGWKFEGIKTSKVIKYSPEEIRLYVSSLTQIDGREDDFSFKTTLDKDKLKSWEINSTMSPMYLQEKYHLFNKIYLSSIILTVDQNTGIFNWKISGVF